MVDDIQRRTETAKRILVSKRNHRRARDRALTRLSHAHKEEYRELLKRERARDEEMGKHWLDITGPVGIQSYKDTIEGSTYPDTGNEGENASYYGGEE